jgi:pyruvate formate lyase activating enzyme
MKIAGLQKFTLLDYPEHTACTVFTAGCNFRCPFCHNSDIIYNVPSAISQDEFFEFLVSRKGKLDGVCISGGEPLLQPDIIEFMQKIRKEGFLVKLDTNGTFPEKLKELVNEGLVDYVAMDIKNSKAKYKETAGINNLDLSKIEESVDFLINGNMDFEFRTTIVNEFHTVEDIQDIVVWVKGAHKYFLQNFVDSGDLIGQDLNPVTLDTLRVMREKATEIIPNVELRGIS